MNSAWQKGLFALLMASQLTGCGDSGTESRTDDRKNGGQPVVDEMTAPMTCYKTYVAEMQMTETSSYADWAAISALATENCQLSEEEFEQVISSASRVKVKQGDFQ